MAVYVMSDIHGEYDKYINMLYQIHFSDKDELYILGDSVDRGSQPMKVLLDMMTRSNVYHIMGNHDLTAMTLLSLLNDEITEENFDKQFNTDTMQALTEWMSDGGNSTITDFRNLSRDNREAVL